MTSVSVPVRALFAIAIPLTALAAVASLVGVDASRSSALVHTSWPDVFLFLGLLVLFVGNFTYYTNLIEPAGETPAQTLVSLAGMVTMAALPIVCLSPRLTPFRYLTITVYGLLVVIKNLNLSERFTDEDSRKLSRIWTRRAIAQTGLAALGGLVYFVLMDPAARAWLFARLVEPPPLTFKPAYERAINLVFNLSFVGANVALYILHQGDISDIKGQGRREPGRLAPVPQPIPPTGHPG